MQFLASKKVIIVLILTLLSVGLIMIFSAGIADAQKRFNSPYYYVWHQLFFGVVPGLVALYLFSLIDYRRWRGWALPILLAAIVLLILVFVPGIGLAARGAQRWINIGVFSFQPSEVMKISLILYLGAWFSGRREKRDGWAYSTIPFLVILGFIWVLFLKQPDVGTLGIITIIAFAMYFFSGAKLSHFGILILSGVIILAGVIFIEPYRLNRVSAFLNPQNDTRGVAYHINQSLIGIGSGGIFGLGFGQSRQKINFLPEPVGDSIFSIIGEELGLLGMGFVITLFFILTTSLVVLAGKIRDTYGRLIVLGTAVWIFSQSFINIAAISGLVPLTGVPLPFISYGGTALIALLAMLGIVTNIADQN